MKSVTCKLLPFLLLLPLTLGAQEAGEDPRDAALAKMRDALRSTTGQLQTAQAEVAAAQAAKVQLERENKQLSDKLQAATAKAEDDNKLASAAMGELNAALEKREKKNAELNDAITKWEAAFGQASKVANATEGERARLAARVIELEQDVATRERNNLELYRVGKEILDRYENFGLGKALLAREPFTGIAKVSLENQVQDYKDKLLEHRDRIGETPAVDPAPSTSDAPTSKPRPATAPSAPPVKR
jgi:chromosome segregation ATPase